MARVSLEETVEKQKTFKELKHIIASDNLQNLNNLVLGWFSEGWNILDTKIIHMDFNNQQFSIFYLIAR